MRLFSGHTDSWVSHKSVQSIGQPIFDIEMNPLSIFSQVGEFV